ncbi:hypothetical protein [Arcobacter sp.]|uniref:hypothetical protein n=1 Tax=Arcobacter sp. TaxID=1872629 RepID=UPI003C78AFEF
MSKIINREAEGVKGPRLQKLRALKLILEKIDTGKFTQCYTALEVDGDLNFVNVPENSTRKIYLEEDKNYNTSSSFSFASKEILNTMVIFLDVWISNRFDSSIFFGFYATNKIAKERTSDKTKRLNIIIPESGILQSVINKDYLSQNDILQSVKKLVIDYYKTSYERQNSTVNGYQDTIEKFDDNTWINFLELIEFNFIENDDLELLKNEVIETIKKMKFYDTQVEGKEEFIYSYLMEELDSRQNASEYSQKFLHKSDIEVAFYKAKGKISNLEVDKTYEMWDNKTTFTNDKRSIEEKMLSVCKDLRSKYIFQKNRISSRSKIEEQRAADEQSFLALKYRIFEKCYDILDEQVNLITSFEESTITNIFNILKYESMLEVKNLSSKYYYSEYDNETIVLGIIHNLFDECYLSLD